jgi:ABC-type polysaccharide/polyol phosphate transport system ATPase subunit
MSSEPGRVVATRLWKRFRAVQKMPTVRDLVTWPPGRGSRDWRWVLRDVDFDIQPGEAVGLMGINGSGKSTLLKLLSRVMTPHSGSVTASGRVGALIEVRAGIHPELSGRENIYIYGSLLGLPRKEIARRFDDIVEFAEIGKAIDRQVKYYSSGMQMRLGFAVAAHLEPDVLLVDEVLAVGDSSFQQRCLERMRQVLQSGTTLVLVSHDLASLEAVCHRGMWLQDGVLVADGHIRDTLGAYRTAIEEFAHAGFYPDGVIRVGDVSIERDDGFMPTTGRDAVLRVTMKAEESFPGRLFIGISEGPATPIFVVSHFLRLAEGETHVECRLRDLPLPRGRYSLWVGMVAMSDKDLVPWHHVSSFAVGGPELDEAPQAVVRLAPVYVDASWSHDGI